MFGKLTLPLLGLVGGFILTGCNANGNRASAYMSARHNDNGRMTAMSVGANGLAKPGAMKPQPGPSTALPADTKLEIPTTNPIPGEPVPVNLIPMEPVRSSAPGIPAEGSDSVPTLPPLTSPPTLPQGTTNLGIRPISYEVSQKEIKPTEGSIIIVNEPASPALNKQPGKEQVVEIKPGESGTLTLTGQVESWRKTWRLRYAPVDAEDANGGSVILVGDNELANLRDGQRLRVQGVLIPAPDRLATPRFLVQSIQAVE